MKKAIFPFNKFTQPHGMWSVCFPNGEIQYEGEYINGVKNGLWVFYLYDKTIDGITYYIT